jgi:hypothetical protein
MKTIIPLLAIPVLAVLVLAGCDKKSPDSSTDMQSTNSSMVSGITNAPATNSLPDMNTNTPAGTNISAIN